MRGRVLRAMSGYFDVDTEDGVLRCTLRGRLKQGKRRTDIAVIGDEVEVEPGASGGGVIDEVLPRRTQFSRRHPAGGGYREDVIVANLDQIVAVLSFGKPAFHPRMLDRFLVIAEHNGVGAVVVANKVDLAEGDEDRARFATYAQIGYPVIYTSATTGEGLDALREQLEGRVSAFAGPSGVGKSSLINAIQPGLALRVGETSDAVGKGRHTTRVAELHRLEAGGWVADTPGIREIGTWKIPVEDLDHCFVELRPYLGRCQFSDCRHLGEPGCAVREARDAGAITEARWDSYARLVRGESE